MSAYPIAPSTMQTGAQYKGFQTRPKAAASTYAVADAAHPSTGDCSQCHSGTTAFTGTAMPTGHIPTPITTCATCHVTPGDYSIATLTTSMPTLHTGITSGCANCHSAGTGKGPFAGCATQAACGTPVPLTYQPKVMPLAAGGSPTSPSTSTHIPVGSVACELCHSPSNFTTFGGLNMKPTSGGGNTAMHTAVGGETCMGCHEAKYTWFGVTIKTRDSGHKGNKAAPNDCNGSGCHKVSTQFESLIRPVPVMRAPVAGGMPRLLPRDVLAPDSAAIGRGFDHQGVTPGQCQTCHNGQVAKGLPAHHLTIRASCDSCHRSSAWKPVQFDHQGVLQGQCQSCHNGINASSKPGSHFVTVRACDSCHRSLAWMPVNYAHLSPNYKPQPDKFTCQGCHITNGEIIPRQMRGNPRDRPVPVGPGQ